MTADGMDNVAVVHMTNAYGSGLADAFVANMDPAHICTQIGYEETTTDFSAAVASVMNDGCTSVMMVSYATDGAALIEEMATRDTLVLSTVLMELQRKDLQQTCLTSHLSTE